MRRCARWCWARDRSGLYRTLGDRPLRRISGRCLRTYGDSKGEHREYDELAHVIRDPCGHALNEPIGDCAL